MTLIWITQVAEKKVCKYFGTLLLVSTTYSPVTAALSPYLAKQRETYVTSVIIVNQEPKDEILMHCSY